MKKRGSITNNQVPQREPMGQMMLGDRENIKKYSLLSLDVAVDAHGVL